MDTIKNGIYLVDCISKMTVTIHPIPHASLTQYDLNMSSSRDGIYFSTSLNLVGSGNYFDQQKMVEMIPC